MRDQHAIEASVLEPEAPPFVHSNPAVPLTEHPLSGRGNDAEVATEITCVLARELHNHGES